MKQLGENELNDIYGKYLAQMKQYPDDIESTVWNAILRKRRHRSVVLSIAGIAASLMIFAVAYYTLSYQQEKSEIQSQFALLGSFSEPTLLINGYTSRENLKNTLSHLTPECIQSINVVKEQESIKHGYPNGMIEVQLKGNKSELFIVCDGTLYFGQNGYIHTIEIEDECSPNLLVDCSEKPLSEIIHMTPQQVKSIKLTTDPLNCNGKHSGEFVVLETK